MWILDWSISQDVIMDDLPPGALVLGEQTLAVGLAIARGLCWNIYCFISEV